MRIRPATEDDLLALAHIFVRTAALLTERYRPEQAGHPPIEPESRVPFLRHLLRTGAIFVSEREGRAIGFSGAVMRDSLWFLSQLWVLPEHHGSGIGRALLEEALAWGTGAEVLAVVASPHPAAQRLYFSAGMYPLWVQHELAGPAAGRVPAPGGVRAIADDDAAWIEELDRDVWGSGRSQDHAFWRTTARGLVLDRGGPAGYAYVWDEGKIGPAAARDATDLLPLIAAARGAIDGPTTIGVPSSNWTVFRELVGAGFAPVGTNTFMSTRALGDATRYIVSGGALG